jgi:2'-5' RNA ligase
VIWIGLNDEGCRLQETQREIETQLGEAGFVLENRAFTAHATLGRVKAYSGKPLEGPLELPAIKTEFKKLDHLILYQSHLSPKGPRYEALETFHFSEEPRS